MINLEKGQKISLLKPGGGMLTLIMMGLGWDAAGGFLGIGGGSIDLDASCAMFDSNNALVDTVWFRQLRSRDASVQHSGDNLTGEGDGDDEKIEVNLTGVAANVKTLVFTINSFQGQTFDKVKNCFARLVDKTTGTEIARYTLSEKGNNTGMIMCKLYRHNNEWKMAAMGTPCNGRTVNDISGAISAIL